MAKSVCVFCSSSDAVAAPYFDAAYDLGEEIARRGHWLVFGGTSVGLMGALARSVKSHGGRIVGVIPQAIQQKGIAYDAADELIVTRDLRERKTVMEESADAFVVLPGGFGTLEEFLEILTLRQLRYHSKPIVLYNAAGFFDPLLALFEHVYSAKFAKEAVRGVYHVTESAGDALDYIESYEPAVLPEKWFR